MTMTKAAKVQRQIDADAREVGLHVKQGRWRLGLLVARNVVRKTVDGEPKVTAADFAKRSGSLTRATTLNYLKAWDLAAKQGHVPKAEELSPGEELALDVESLPNWSEFYYEAVHGSTEAYAAEAEKEGLQARTVAQVAKNKTAIKAAIKADPKVAEAAVDAAIEADPDHVIEAAARITQRRQSETDAAKGKAEGQSEPMSPIELEGDEAARRAAVNTYHDAAAQIHKAAAELMEFGFFEVEAEVATLRAANKLLSDTMWDVESRLTKQAEADAS